MAHDANAEFGERFHFKQEITIVIKHSQGKHLRCKPLKNEEVDADGGTGKFARWKVKLHKDDQVQFENEHSGKYLRIHKDTVDVGGVGGPFTFFKLHFQNNGVYKLESVKHAGQYIAVDKNGVRVGKGGPWCRLEFYKQGHSPFTKPYMFNLKSECVIEHRGGAFLRVDGPKDNHAVHTDGGVGEFARWEVEPLDGGKECKIQSKKSGNYLRIHKGTVDCGGIGGPFTVFKVHQVDAPHHVRLESKKHAGEFLVVDFEHKKVHVGDANNKHCLVTFYRD